MKTLRFVRQSAISGQDYSDILQVIGDNGLMLVEVPCRTFPNPYRPSDRVSFDRAYGVIALGTYHGRFIQNHQKFGLCVLIEEGGAVSAALPNFNHGGQHIVKEAFVHTGYADDNPATPQDEAWSGSAGCLTIPKADAGKVFCLFVAGERVAIELTGIRAAA